MAYAPNIDFLALLRQTSGGVRAARVPGLDYVVAAMARAGLFLLVVGQVAPTSNQAATVWLKPAFPNSWAIEGSVFMWNANTTEYEPATPALWSALLSAASPPSQVVQDVTAVGPVNVQPDANIVRVMNVGAAVTLVMPPSGTKVGPVLISDWANGASAHNIIITLASGGDAFPGGVTVWTLGADTASVFLRPVPGGYTL